MTIRRAINAQELSKLLGYAQTCVDDHPTGFGATRELLEIIGEHCDTMIAEIRDLGFKVDNSDGVREVEAVLFGWILSSNNPEQTQLDLAIHYGQNKENT